MDADKHALHLPPGLTGLREALKLLRVWKERERVLLLVDLVWTPPDDGEETIGGIQVEGLLPSLQKAGFFAWINREAVNVKEVVKGWGAIKEQLISLFEPQTTWKEIGIGWGRIVHQLVTALSRLRYGKQKLRGGERELCMEQALLAAKEAWEALLMLFEFDDPSEIAQTIIKAPPDHTFLERIPGSWRGTIRDLIELSEPLKAWTVEDRKGRNGGSGARRKWRRPSP